MQRSLSKAANYVLGQFSRFGVAIPEQSRIKSMYKSVCNDDGSSRGWIPESEPDFAIAREALRDFRQLEFFLNQIDNDAQDAQRVEYLQLLNRIAGDSDSVLPQDDDQNSPSRDAQAEAFVFAVFQNASLTPSFAEPDITCSVGVTTFGVAIKRIKNLSKLKTRVARAAGQIHKSGLPGIICVEVTLAVNRSNDSIYTNESEQNLKSWWTEQMRLTTNEFLEDVKNEEVRGILLHAHCPVRFSDGQYSLRSMNYGIGTSKNEDGKEEWRQFKATFIKGLPNPMG